MHGGMSQFQSLVLYSIGTKSKVIRSHANFGRFMSIQQHMKTKLQSRAPACLDFWQLIFVYLDWRNKNFTLNGIVTMWKMNYEEPYHNHDNLLCRPYYYESIHPTACSSHRSSSFKLLPNANPMSDLLPEIFISVPHGLNFLRVQVSM